MEIQNAHGFIQWTAPYYGVQHTVHGIGTKRDKHGRRCSVNGYDSFAVLKRHFDGCGFSPRESWHSTAEEARAAGEQWLVDPAN
jgi:hypothetical protein